MSLKAIKNKIRAVDKTRKVTKAMEAVSAVKMRKSQERALGGRPYALSALTILRNVSGSFEGAKHALAETRPIKNVLVVLITSDKGLAGMLNTAVLKETHGLIETLGVPENKISFIALGKKGAEHFEKRGFTIRKRFENVSDSVSSEDMEEVSTLATELFLTKEIDACYIAFTSFISTFEQKPIVRQVLPLAESDIEAVIAGILPQKGKYSAPAPREVKSLDYLIEPDSASVLGEVFPLLTRILVYHALLESKASEHSARMVAMKNASDKARDLSKDLNRTFNKVRQAVITREVSEIVGGIEAMA